MRLPALAISIVSIGCGLVIHAGIAHAAIETWVSPTGDDSGNCQVIAPCRTFQFAHDQTNNNGAINVLSSGNFGPLTITKPISIVADGVEAIINTAAGDPVSAGIIVQAGGGAVVSLRGLTIDLRGTNNFGIDFDSGGALHVQHSVIRRSLHGINFSPNSGTPELYVADSVIADAVQHGINVSPTGSAGATVVLDRVRVENAGLDGVRFNGQLTTGSLNGTVRESLVAGNGSAGIRASEDDGGGTTTVMIDRSAAVNNGIGVDSNNEAARIRIGNSTVSGNNVGIRPFGGGVIDSYQTNKIDGNSANGLETDNIPTK